MIFSVQSPILYRTVKRRFQLLKLSLAFLLSGSSLLAGDRFELIDVFGLEFADEPQVSPDGSRVVYVRNFMDIMKDVGRSNLWIVDADGSNHRALTSGNENHGSPRWSPSGDRLVYTSNEDGKVQLYLRWMDTGQTAKLTNLTSAPSGMTWSPDGKWIAFSMLVEERPHPLVRLPEAPAGASWAPPAKVIDRVEYRSDGQGYLPYGYWHLFVLSAEGGSPRQLTAGEFHHRGSVSWAPDSSRIFFSANRHDDWEYEPENTELYSVDLKSDEITVLTERFGPDQDPAVSPDGTLLAYSGLDDRFQGYQVSRLYVMDLARTTSRCLSCDFDRSVGSLVWSGNGRGIYFDYTDKGNGKIGYLGLDGARSEVAQDLGGTSLGRPYEGGSFSVSNNDRIAYTYTRPEFPADVAVIDGRGSATRRLTHLNKDLLSHKKLGKVEEIWFKSSFDGRDLQGWIVTPPEFDASRRYPLILEIHGGPFADYGDRFAAEMQLYAAAGYVVLYMNPRGSTSYGEEFGNLIHHNYPSQDYDDLMSGVDAVISKGYVDENRLYVTGGSGGGVLSSWIIGKTNRFMAAVVAKPVINWYSFVLTADHSVFFTKYWFPSFPWEDPEHYLNRSPISLVGNVKTPTMVLTGEADFRTPISESEQYYQALKLQKVDSVLVRIPEASHGITLRPSNLMAKVAHILTWFEKHR